MSTDRRDDEPVPGAGPVAIVAVLAPVLAGTVAVLFLVIGYTVKTVSPGSTFSASLITNGWIFGAITSASILIAAVGLLITALRTGGEAAPEPDTGTASAAPQRQSRRGNGTVGIASFVAGRRRTHLREEWAAVLAGAPEHGIVLSPRTRMRYALGFLWAALRLRVRDLAAPLWVPVDWTLAVESRTNGFIAAVVGAQAVWIVGHGGLTVLVTDVWEPCAIVGGALYVLVRWLRRVRGIELAAAPRDDAPPD
ncbi:hypothetical protein [Streptomyces sp. 142MFCol3.1]|uniref:hypothetical protein n=1 Tax=Streptomyces sp. 142MFCol3.1 TaxID=1172179 RepID=UPI0003FF206D|nr:hypothetical protein [Streptomyces sp. 142MFCol3.1]